MGLELPHARAGQALEGIDALGLDDQARELFLGGKARRLLSL
ncbi:MAG TPA: hypothetical protein VLP43_12550 [Solirubrobacteraceae bacterium]|nr:hypothetical protein [Solirubrobacteraceae bacterium]